MPRTFLWTLISLMATTTDKMIVEFWTDSIVYVERKGNNSKIPHYFPYVGPKEGRERAVQEVLLFCFKWKLRGIEKHEKKSCLETLGGDRWGFVSCVLPVTLLNSSMISILPLDLGMLPTKRRRLGTLTLIFRCRPPFISKSFNCVCTYQPNHR